jgi:ADP-heptose:LPS heptosyltransferase
MLNHFGLREKLNFTPHNLQLNQIKNKIGIFPGSSNQPLKRWPLDNWKKLISKLLENDSSIEIHIYGTANERKKINSCIGAFCGSRVINKCGRTNIWELAKELVSCVKVIGNDSGGMHLANFLGVECIILFGPTNPRITAPIFESKMQIIKPKKIDGQLSHDLNDLTIDEVFNTI